MSNLGSIPKSCFSEPVPSPACVSWMCDPEVLWLRTVSRHLMKSIKKGLTVEAKVSSYGDKVFKGKIDFISSRINADTRSLLSRIKIRNDRLWDKLAFLKVLSRKIGCIKGQTRHTQITKLRTHASLHSVYALRSCGYRGTNKPAKQAKKHDEQANQHASV